MIYCPKCGTANPDGSNFCNHCGQRLPGVVVRCPMCSTPNPMGTEVCLQCGARLMPLDLTKQPAQAVMDEGEPSSAEVATPAPETPAAETPEPSDWLTRLRAIAAEGHEEAGQGMAPETEAGATPGEELPSQTRALRQAEEPEVEGTPAPPAETSKTAPLPAWLREIVGEEAQAETASTPAGAEAQVPPWLRRIVESEEAVESGALGEETPTAPEAASLAESHPEEPEAAMVLPDGEPAPAEEAAAEAPTTREPQPEMPPEEGKALATQDFILEPAVPDWLREAAEVPAVREPVSEEEEIPDWLRTMITPEKGDEASLEALAAELAPPAEEPASEGEAPRPEGPTAEAPVPGWLHELAAEEPTAATEQPEAAEPELAQGEIPKWVEELRPTPEQQVAPPAEKPVEGKGVLAGVKGILPIEMLWALPKRAETTPSIAIMPQEASAGDIVAELLSAQPESHALPAWQPGAAIPGPWARRLLYLLLALVIIVPLLFGADWFSQTVAVNDATWSMYDTINKLPPDSTVLLSFDYDPVMAAELDLQAGVILRHLLQRDLRVVALSLVPQGPALAQAVWDKVAATDNYVYGEDFVNLGYVSGEQAALRSLVNAFPPEGSDFFQSPLSSLPMLSQVKGLRDIPLVVVLAGDQRFVRAWLEQVPSQIPVKVAAAVSGLVGPAVLPYFQSGQLVGHLVGLTGAAEYEIAINQPSAAVASLGAQSAGHILVIVVILMGNVAALFAAARRRK